MTDNSEIWDLYTQIDNDPLVSQTYKDELYRQLVQLDEWNEE